MHIVLFDIDGTLLDSGGAGRSSLNLAFQKTHAWDDALNGITLNGATDQMIVEEVFRNRRRSGPTPSEAARVFGLYLSELKQTLRTANGFRVLPGIGRLLARLAVRPDVLTGLATGNIEKGARIKLGRARLNHRFAFGGFGSDARLRSDIVKIAVERARAHLPADREGTVWVVGDTPSDVEAGKAAGAYTVAVATGGIGPDALRATGPDHLFENLADCDTFLATLDSADPRGK